MQAYQHHHCLHNAQYSSQTEVILTTSCLSIFRRKPTEDSNWLTLYDFQVGVAFLDAALRRLGACEFADDEHFCNLEAVTTQLGAKECVMPKARCLHVCDHQSHGKHSVAHSFAASGLLVFCCRQVAQWCCPVLSWLSFALYAGGRCVSQCGRLQAGTRCAQPV